MRVLMMTQMLDVNDEILGFTHQWVAALAARVDHVTVMPVKAGDYDTPPNVTVLSMGKEQGLTRLGRANTFYRHLYREIKTADVLFAHMSPRYVLAAAPIALPLRKPITMWFTHRTASPELRLSIPLTTHIATAHESSFPLTHPKVNALGHGIDIQRYTPADSLPPDPPQIVSLARLAAPKRHEVLIRAAAILRDEYGDPPARYRIIGRTLPGTPVDYEHFLRAEIERLGVGDRVTMEGFLPADTIPALYQQTAISLNASLPGHFDKSALEGMLCAVPTVVASAGYDHLLGEYVDGLRIGGDDPAELAAKLNHLLRMTPDERRAIGLKLRDRTAQAHSLSGLMDRLVALLAS